ncbi:MAG TPA: hypothetical protein VIM58_05670, partial [Candidatus Methylacidiphilales bacterium]
MNPEPNPADRLFERGRLWNHFALFALFYAAWAVANFPGLAAPWWQTDDFVFTDRCNLLKGVGHALHESWALYANDGRPFSIPIALLFTINQPAHAAAGLFAHWLQAALHVFGAFVLSRTLARYVKPWQAALASLPFLLWSFNSECVLWTNSFQYVWGYLVAIWGIREFLVGSETGNRHRLWIGTALVGAAVLTQQSPSGTPLMVWLIAVALRALGKAPFDAAQQKRLFWKELALLCGAMVVACVVALVLGHLNGGTRTHLSLHPGQRFYYLRVLDGLFLWWPKPQPDFYPVAVKVLHGFLLASFLGLVARHFAKDRRAAFLCLLAAGAALVLPYWAHLITDTFSPSFRVFYAAPLLFAAVIAIGFVLAARAPAVRGLLVVLVLLLSWEYARIAHAQSGEYVELYRKQVEVVRQAEALARENGCDTLAVCPPPIDSPVKNLNPFGLHYFFWDSRQSSLHFFYSAARLVRAHTTMKVLTWQEAA